MSTPAQEVLLVERVGGVVVATLNRPDRLNSLCVDLVAALDSLCADIEAGLAAQISGTPAVFLNGVLIGGALPKDKLIPLIDKAKQAPSLAAPEP